MLKNLVKYECPKCGKVWYVYNATSKQLPETFECDYKHNCCNGHMDKRCATISVSNTVHKIYVKHKKKYILVDGTEENIKKYIDDKYAKNILNKKPKLEKVAHLKRCNVSMKLCELAQNEFACDRIFIVVKGENKFICVLPQQESSIHMNYSDNECYNVLVLNSTDTTNLLLFGSEMVTPLIMDFTKSYRGDKYD